MQPESKPHLEPFHLGLDEFLTGDEEGELDIDDIFAKSVTQILSDWRDMPEMLTPDENSRRSSLFHPEYHFEMTPAGQILRHRFGIVGVYLGCDLSVAPEHQGKGLGMELVIERVLADGTSPVWFLDNAAYSRAGLAAHKAAWRHARANRAETGFRWLRQDQE